MQPTTISYSLASDCREDVFSPAYVEQRSVPRVEPDPEAAIEVQIMGDGFLDVLLARDICENGIGIYVAHGFEGCRIDCDVKLCITLPGHSPFLANGRIVHEPSPTKNFFGVVFTKIFIVDQRKIRSYLKKRLAELGYEMHA